MSTVSTTMSYEEDTIGEEAGLSSPPLPNLFEQEYLHLTNIKKFFPEPVWEYVMTKLDSYQDINNCSGASVFFGKLLQNKRLPQVFSVLTERFQQNYKTDDSYVERNIECIPWIQHGGHRIDPLTGILKCRLVCKSWNQAIEKAFADLHQTSHEDQFEFEAFKFGKFYLNASPQVFLSHFESTHMVQNVIQKNPILGASARFTLYESNNAEIQEYLANGQKMISLYGKYIKNLKISFYIERSIFPLITYYRLLRHFVESCNNLATLKIESLSAFNQPTPEELTDLDQDMEQNPFPRLSFLQKFQITDVPHPIYRQIIQQNPQLNTNTSIQ